jgi:thioredoxin reductase (NADPH)
MIGADPCTEACDGMLAVDAAGYLLCGEAAAACTNHLRWPRADRRPQLLETTRPGVFAAGDVRRGSVKRVASAVGEGSVAIQQVHRYLVREQLDSHPPAVEGRPAKASVVGS